MSRFGPIFFDERVGGVGDDLRLLQFDYIPSEIIYIIQVYFRFGSVDVEW